MKERSDIIHSFGSEHIQLALKRAGCPLVIHRARTTSKSRDGSVVISIKMLRDLLYGGRKDAMLY